MEERKQFKQWLDGEGQDSLSGKFSEEAAEGWTSLSPDKFDHLMASIDDQIDAKVQQQSGDRNNSGKLIRLNVYRWLSVAAAVALVVIAWWILDKRMPDNEQLYATYFQVRTHPDAMVRGDNEKTEEEQRKAVSAYTANDFASSIREYELLLKIHPQEPKYTLFLAVSYMAEGKTDKAIQLLEGFTVKNNAYEPDMRWYLALAYIKKGSVNTAKGLLDSLSKGESYYSGSAKELLSAMK